MKRLLLFLMLASGVVTAQDTTTATDVITTDSTTQVT